MRTKASDQNIATIKKIVNLLSNGTGLVGMLEDSNKKIMVAKKIPKGRHTLKCLMHVYSVTAKNSVPNKITGRV